MARIGFGALVLDTVVVYGYVLVYSFEPGTPIRQLVFIPLIEAALRYGIVGAFAMSAVSACLLAFTEWWREDRFPPQEFDVDRIILPVGVQLILGLVVGSLVERLRDERRGAGQSGRGRDAARRARSPRGHPRRDQPGRAGARILLDQSQAFAAFIRELRGLIAFERTAIVLLEDGSLRVFAAAGEGVDSVFRRERLPLSRLGRRGHRRRRTDDLPRRHVGADTPRKPTSSPRAPFACRCAHPVRRRRSARSPSSVESPVRSSGEIELLGLLGRLVGSAIQNIRAYEAERTTVEASQALRAPRRLRVARLARAEKPDGVGHRLHARTLEQRWRELSPEQRESFLALIAHETSRLAELIGDVLDTSRIESGTFSYSFEDVDLARLVRDSAAAAEHGQDE